MIVEILNIRIKQAYRILSQVGLFRTVFLLVFLAPFLAFLFIKTRESNYEEMMGGIFLLSVLFIHIKRKDKEFLEIHAPKPQQVFFTEYLFLSAPMLVSMLYKGMWKYFVVYLIVLALIPCLKITFRKNSINSIFQKQIPDGNFEWKSGIRKYFLLFVVLWPLGLITSFFVASVPVTIFFLGAIVLSFYEKSEPLQILIASELNTSQFLMKKIKSQLLSFSVLILPLVIAFIIFHPRYYYIPSLEYVIFLILLVYTILLKYAYYQPAKEPGAVKTFTIIGSICLFIPVLIPLILILSVKFLFQASHRLNFYLNDFD